MYERSGSYMPLKCLRHVPDTIELNGASTVWDMFQVCLRHIWEPGLCTIIMSHNRLFFNKKMSDILPEVPMHYFNENHGEATVNEGLLDAESEGISQTHPYTILMYVCVPVIR